MRESHVIALEAELPLKHTKCSIVKPKTVGQNRKRKKFLIQRAKKNIASPNSRKDTVDRNFGSWGQDFELYLKLDFAKIDKWLVLAAQIIFFRSEKSSDQIYG